MNRLAPLISTVAPLGRRARRLLVVGTSLIILLLGLLACGDESAPLTSPETPAETSLHKPKPPESGPDWCIRIDQDDDDDDDDDDQEDIIDSLLEDWDLHPVDMCGPARMYLVSGEVDAIALADDPRVHSLQPNSAIVRGSPVEVLFGFHEGGPGDGALEAPDPILHLQLDAAHQMSTGAGVRVAVLDSGIDVGHPDFRNGVETGPIPTLGGQSEKRNKKDDDGDGVVDEGYGHGTHMAGLIRRVAPGAIVIPIRIFDDEGRTDVFRLAIGLYYARERQADIVNLSMVLEDESPLIDELLEELRDAGILIVAAAGNTPGAALYPASSPLTLSVGASNFDNELADFSASEGVQLLAPGVNVLSSYPKKNIAAGSGTSMACAIASGCVALLIEKTEDTEAAAQILCETATPIGGAGVIYGRIAPAAALASIAR